MLGFRKKMETPDRGKLRVFAQFPNGPVPMKSDGPVDDALALRYSCTNVPYSGMVSWVRITDEHGNTLGDVHLDRDVAVNAGDTFNVTLDDIKFFPKELMELEPSEPSEQWRWKPF